MSAPWIVLVVSLAMAGTASLLVSRSLNANESLRFENAVQATQDRLTGRLNLYLTVLRGGVGLFAASDTVDAADFRAFVQQLELDHEFPGIQGIGWSQRLVADPAGNADIHAIQYLEPEDERNRAALGFDMFSEAARREAMARARDTGRAALSGRVTLRQEIDRDKQPGFLLYVPLYRTGHTPPDVAGRRAQLEGFVYAPFRADDLFAGIFGSEQSPRVSFRVFDGESAAPDALLYASPSTPGHRTRRTGTAILEIAGRPWTVVYETEPGFEAGTVRFYVPMTAGIGFLVSLVVFGLALRLDRARSAAEAANEAKMQFLATMSHELRTPLNAILGYVDLLDLGVYGTMAPEQGGVLGRVRRASTHLLGLIDDVLRFARLEAGRITYDVQTVPVGAALIQAEQLILPQASAAGIHYQRLSGRREADAKLGVRADPDKLQQILINLLSNAIKFTERGGRVTLSADLRPHGVEIEVADTGIGIPAEKLDTVFDPFVQVDGTLTRRHGGTGLGLAIGRELARGMGGDITAASEPGEGSRFTIVLPYVALGDRSAARPGSG